MDCYDTVSSLFTTLPAPDAGFRSYKSSLRTYSFFAIDPTLLGYEWDFGDKTTGIEPFARHTYANDGTYIVFLKATDSNNCVNASADTLNVNISGISPEFDEKLLTLKLSPNPFTDEFNFSYSLQQKSNVIITISDIGGKTIATLTSGIQPAGMQNYAVKAADYQMTSGVYLLNITIDGQVMTREIIKQ
jgi:hypothetical protein